jgi:hypothetical protein
MKKPRQVIWRGLLLPFFVGKQNEPDHLVVMGDFLLSFLVRTTFEFISTIIMQAFDLSIQDFFAFLLKKGAETNIWRNKPKIRENFPYLPPQDLSNLYSRIGK